MLDISYGQKENVTYHMSPLQITRLFMTFAILVLTGGLTKWLGGFFVKCNYTSWQSRMGLQLNSVLSPAQARCMLYEVLRTTECYISGQLRMLKRLRISASQITIGTPNIYIGLEETALCGELILVCFNVGSEQFFQKC